MPWLLALLLLTSSLSIAAEVNQQSRVEVQQKLQLLKMLLSGRPVADDQSKEPRTLSEKASNAFAAGKFTLAGTFADEALTAIEDTNRQSITSSKVEQTRYADMLEDVLSLEAMYVSLYKGLSKPEKQTFDALVKRAPPLIVQAQDLVRDRHYHEAIDRLETVHEIYIATVNKIVGDTSVVYDKKFNSPADEFDYELSRYRSYEELLPLAIERFQPSSGVLQLSDRYVKDSQEIRKKSKKQAANGDHQSAIQTLQNATKRLQTALRAIGLIVPK